MGENEYEINNYYTALQVAEILGLDKRTVIYRCTKDWYSGAFKTAPPQNSKENGQWLIPKRLIDVPTEIKDVATLTRQINPMELEKTINHAITHAVTAAVEPLNKKLEDQAEIIQKQAGTLQRIKENHEQNTEKILKEIEQSRMANQTHLHEEDSKTRESIDKMTVELSRLNKPKESSYPGWLLWLLLLIILTLAVFVFMNWGKITTKMIY